MVILTISILIFISGCIGIGGNQTYSSNGINFNYPGGWYKTPGQGNVNVSDIAIPVIVTVGDKFNEETGVLVLLANNNTSGEISTGLIKAAIGKYGFLMSEGYVTVDGVSAHEFVYNTTLSGGTVKKERLILLEKNQAQYILIFTALPADFEGQETNFKMIQNSFKVQ